MLSDILANAGWLFFVAYSAVVAAVSFAAFGGDVLAAKVQADPSRKSGPTETVQSTHR